MWTIYMHTCKVNDKKYIGITSQEPYYARFNGNGSGYKTSIKFWNAIQKYGWDNFTHEVLKTTDSEEDAKELERYYIKHYQTQNDMFGYNIKEGGQCESLPVEVKEKISRSHIGKPGTTTGRKHTADEKRRMSESQKGRSFTPEHLANLRKAQEAYRGKPTRHMPTKDEIAKAAEASRVKVLCVETNQVFNSISDAANWLGVLISNMSRAIKQGRAYKGYHFQKICSEKPNDYPEKE